MIKDKCMKSNGRNGTPLIEKKELVAGDTYKNLSPSKKMFYIATPGQTDLDSSENCLSPKIIKSGGKTLTNQDNDENNPLLRIII